MSYLPEAKEGHALHVETGQVVHDAQSMLSEVLLKIVSRWIAQHTRSSYQTESAGLAGTRSLASLIKRGKEV